MRPPHFACLFAVFIGTICISTMVLAQPNPLPLLNQPLVPDCVPPGSPQFTLTVNGTGFVSGAVGKWNGSPRVTVVHSGSSLEMTINAADVANAGTATVTVTNPRPGGGTSNPVYFPVRNSSPTVQFEVLDYKIPYPGLMVVGDFDNDGKPDLAVADINVKDKYATEQVYLGKGDGSFKAPINTGPFKYGASPRLVGDFNGDGNLDLMLVNSRYCAAILLGKGNGKFTAKPVFGCQAHYMAAADFNGDGKLDVILVENQRTGGGTFAIYLGKGDGTFRLASGGVSQIPAATPLSVISMAMENSTLLSRTHRASEFSWETATERFRTKFFIKPQIVPASLSSLRM